MSTKDKPEGYEKVLGVHVRRIADETCKAINSTVPASVEGMQYARQWVLEEVIKLLEGRV